MVLDQAGWVIRSHHPDQLRVGLEGRQILMTLPTSILRQQKQYVYLCINMHICIQGTHYKLQIT